VASNKQRTQKITVIQKEIKLFAFALALYALIFILIPGLYTGFFWEENETLNLIIPDREVSSFHTSFFASATQDVLFFLVIGIYAWVRSTTRPEEKLLSEKVSYLFPSANNETELKDFFQSRINRLGCISDETRITITVDSYDFDSNTFKVFISMKIILHNLHHMDSFSDPQACLEFKSDLEEAPSDGIYGQIRWIEVTKLDDSRDLIYSHADHSHPPHLIKDRHYSLPAHFQIEPYEKVQLDSNFWLKEPALKDFTYTTFRYVRRLIVSVSNMSDIDLSYVVLEKPGERETGAELKATIAKHHEKTIEMSNVCAEESVVVKFDPILHCPIDKTTNNS
jgi:hypothetical protein